jgi:hypothetical protein
MVNFIRNFSVSTHDAHMFLDGQRDEDDQPGDDQQQHNVEDADKESIADQQRQFLSERSVSIVDDATDEDGDDKEDGASTMNASFQLEAGDHIYSWRALGTYSHHGIVLSVSKVAVVIVDFYPEAGLSVSEANWTSPPCDENDNVADNSSHQTRSNALQVPLKIRTLEGWTQIYGRPNKVIYQASYLGRTLRRSGTCTSVDTAPSCLVMARVRFLLSIIGEASLPPYHYMYANSETASFWCKTGEWATLQVADFLHVNIAGQLKSSVSLAGYVSTQTVSVPSAGFWGYLGFTTKATLAATQPYLLPLIASYGIITVGGPLWMLHQGKAKWKEYGEVLHDSFWSNVENDVIVECLNQWWIGSFDEDEDKHIDTEGSCSKANESANAAKPDVISL